MREPNIYWHCRNHRKQGREFSLVNTLPYYRHWVKGPWGENDVETLLSYQTNDFEVVSITAGNVAPGFQLKSWLKDISIPSSVTNIGHGAFYGCANLTNVSLHARIDRIRDSMFLGTGLKTIAIPETVSAIDYAAFNSCSNLCEITTPASVKEIGEFAFGACYSLTNAVIMGATNICQGAFWKCYDLKSVTLPLTLKHIGSHAFAVCTSLETIVIPDSVEDVDVQAFLGSTNLSRLVIGRNVSSFAAGYLEGIKDLEIRSASVVSLLASSDDIIDSVTNLVVSQEIEIPEGFYSHFPSVKQPGGNGNSGEIDDPNAPVVTVLDGLLVSVQGVGLTSLDIPNTVTQVADTAFVDCSELREIIIPDSVEFIEANAFHNCTNLERLVVGSGVMEVGAPLFSWTDEIGNTRYGSPSLKELVVASPQFYEAMFMDEYWNFVAEFPSVTNVVFGWQFEDVPENVGYIFPSLVVSTVEAAFPQINSGTESEIALALSDALKGSRDNGLTNITDIATYDAFVNWAESVGGYGQSRNQTLAMVKKSSNAWLSFALGTDALINKELSSDDVKIDSFTPDIENGQFAFEVSIDGVDIGSGSVAETTLKANLKKALGVEGATSLSPDAFSPDNIEVSFDAPQNGKARFTATPPADAGNSFFMRVKVK